MSTRPPDSEDVRASRAAAEAADALVAWQKRLLPFMTRSIVAMAVLFFVLTAVNLYQVSRFIDDAQGANVRAQVGAEIAKGNGGQQAFVNSLVLLEADALDKRYHQANALLLSRIWSRQMAFITGMVLAFIGAVFILGKMSDSTASHVEGGGADWKVAVSSASPGIVLSVLGTALLVTSLLVHTTLDVTDGAAYLSSIRLAPAASAASSASDAAPLGLDNLKQLDQHRKEHPEEQR